MAVKRQLGARIDPVLFKQLKMLAVEQEKPVAELVEEAITDLLAKYRGRRPHA